MSRPIVVPPPYSRSIWLAHFQDPTARRFINIRIVSSFLMAAYVIFFVFTNKHLGWFPPVSLGIYIVVPIVATLVFLRHDLPFWSMMVQVPAYGIYLMSNIIYAMLVLHDATRAMTWVPWLTTSLVEVTIWFDSVPALLIMGVPTLGFLVVVFVYCLQMPLRPGTAGYDMLVSLALSFVATIALQYLNMNFRKFYALSLAQAEKAAATEAAERQQIEVKLMTTQLELERLSRNLTMSALAASIAHEINQPLSALVTNASAGLRWLDANNQGEARAAFSQVIEEGNRAASVITSMRRLLRKHDQEPQLVDIKSLVNDAINLTARECECKDVRISVKFEPNPLKVFGDNIQLQQLFINLIRNGLDAMESVPPKQRAITIMGWKNSDDVMISFEDSGPGIPQERRHKIFDAFFTTKKDGMGMGLAICKSIVDSMGGQLSIASSATKKTVFLISFPAIAGDRAQYASQEPEKIT